MTGETSVLSGVPGGFIANAATRFTAKQRIMPISYTRAFRGGRRHDEETFRAKVAHRLGAEVSITPLGRARSGIYLLTRFALQSGRRKVLLSPFTIPDVVTMTILAGAEPVFFDFEPDSTFCRLKSLRALIGDETACVFATHYHVNEPRLREIAEICRARGVRIFDDCALAFGGSIEGRPIGTLTDASVFSFSSFKLLNYFWGGMITTGDPEIARFVEAAVRGWPRLGTRDYLTPAAACLRYDMASRPPLFSSLIFPWIRRGFQNSARDDGLRHTRIETVELNSTLTSRPAPGAFAEWWPKLERVDRWLARRRSIARIYRRVLGHLMVSGDVPEPVPEGSCFVNFPIVVPGGRARKIRRELMLAGYDVGGSLYPNVHREPGFRHAAGQSDNVSRLVDGTIYLPTHFGVSETYAEAIARRVANAVGPGC